MLRHAHVVRIALVCLVATVGGTLAVHAQDQADTVAVEGDPALTHGMIGSFLGFMEWLLDVPLTAEQRTDVSTGMIRSWQTGDAQERQGTLNILAVAEQLRQGSEAERALVREQLQAKLLGALRQMPDDPTAKWMLAIYEAGHQPIADGTPPLTRQVTDAFAELMCFMIGEVLGQEVPVPDEFREAAAGLLAARYVELTPEGQQEVSQLPIAWAAIRVAWGQMPEEDKEQYRAQWRETLQSSLPQQPVAGADQTAANPPPTERAENDLDALVKQKLAADPLYQNMTSQFMSNLLQTQHNGTMAMLYNMGGTGWTYQPRW